MKVKLLLILLTTSCLVAPGSSRAIGVPSNALSQATGMPTTLLDGPQLDYAFPARSLLHDSLVGGLGREFDTILVQVNDGRIGGFLHRGTDPSLGGHLDPVVPTRLGLALRTGRFHWSVSGEYALADQDQRIDRGGSERNDTDVRRTEVWRVGLGGGYQAGRVEVDLRATVGTDDFHQKSIYSSPAVYSARVSDLERELYGGVEGRVRLPVGDDDAVTLTAYLQDGSVEANLLREASSVDDEYSERWSSTPDPFRWGVGAAVEVRRDERLRVIGFGHFTRTVHLDELRLDVYQSVWRRTRSDLDTRSVEAGAVVRYEPWADTEMLVGARLDTRRRIGTTHRADGQPGDPRVTSSLVQKNETTTIDERFSWGVQQRWRGLHIVGAVDTSLDIDDLFLSLDAIYSF